MDQLSFLRKPPFGQIFWGQHEKGNEVVEDEL